MPKRLLLFLSCHKRTIAGALGKELPCSGDWRYETMILIADGPTLRGCGALPQ